MDTRQLEQDVRDCRLRYQAAPTDENTDSLLMALARLGSQYGNEGSLRESSDALYQAYNLCETVNGRHPDYLQNRLREAKICCLLANLALQMNNTRNALAWAQQAEAVIKPYEGKNGDPDIIYSLGMSKEAAALAYEAEKNDDAAEQCFEQAAAYYERAFPQIGELQALLGQAECLRKAGGLSADFSRAASLTLKSYGVYCDLAKIDESNDVLRGIRTAANQLGWTYKQMGRLQEALDWQKKSLDAACTLASRTNAAIDRAGIVLAYNELGDVSRQLNRIVDAVFYYRASIPIAEGILRDSTAPEDYSNLINAHIALSEILETQGKLREAEDNLHRAMALSQEAVRVTRNSYAYEHLAFSYYSLGRFAGRNRSVQEGVDLLKQCLQIIDSIPPQEQSDVSLHFIIGASETLAAVYGDNGMRREAEYYLRRKQDAERRVK